MGPRKESYPVRRTMNTSLPAICALPKRGLCSEFCHFGKGFTGQFDASQNGGLVKACKICLLHCDWSINCNQVRFCFSVLHWQCVKEQALGHTRGKITAKVSDWTTNMSACTVAFFNHRFSTGMLWHRCADAFCLWGFARMIGTADQELAGASTCASFFQKSQKSTKEHLAGEVVSNVSVSGFWWAQLSGSVPSSQGAALMRCRNLRRGCAGARKEAAEKTEKMGRE